MSLAVDTLILSALQAREENHVARRRFQQKGNLYSQGGYWKLRWMVDVIEDGEVRRKWCSPVVIGPAPGNKFLKPINKREAQRLAWDNFLSKIDQNITSPRSAMPFGEFVEQRFRPDHMADLKNRTQQLYDTLLKNHILPFLEKAPLCEIKVYHCQAVINAAREKKLSSQTVTHVRNVMSAVFERAIDLEWIESNPARRVRLPQVQHKERIALTWNQVEQIATTEPKIATLVRFLGRTGVRIGEALGLRWRSVNLTETTKDGIPPFSFIVRESWTNRRWETTKTLKGVRIFPMTSAVWVMLQEIWEASAFQSGEHTVFTLRNGRPMDPRNLTKRYLKPAGRKLGMPWVSFHYFRHTAATIADQSGMTVAERMRILGHASERMTLHYTHADQEAVREKLERVN